MKRSFSVLVLVVCSLTLAPSPASALTYAVVSDETLADRAHVIVEVQVLEVDPSPDTGGAVTDYLMAVEHVIQGDVLASPLTVRMAGGIQPDGTGLHVYGAPSFVEEQRVLLFLRSRPDGTFGVLHYMLGVFHLVESDGRILALRRLAETEELVLPDREPPRVGPRDLERFRAWLSDRARGVERTGDYFVDDAEIAESFEKFTILRWRSGNGLRIRWRTFDTGGRVGFRAHSGGQPGLPNGGFSETSAAIAVWRNDPNTPINIHYDGQTSIIGTGLGFDEGATRDGRNTVLFDDLATPSAFDEPFSCEDGGTIAFGGLWFSGTHVHNGETFNTAVEGDVVTNKGIDCLPGGQGPPWIARNRRAAETLTHEIGHSLGLGHSCGDDFSPSCGSSSTLNDATMRATIHSDNRGAAIRSDDRAGIRFLYGEPITPPAAPSSLTATAVSSSQIDLTWSDNSDDEESFDLERSVGGTFNRIALPAANSTSYQDATAQPGVTYTYRLRAFNDGGTSAFSNTASATTFQQAAPTDLSAFGASDTSIQLFWTDPSTTETGFEIEGRTGGAPFSLLQTVGANSEETLIEGLNPLTTYTFRVRAIGPAGNSGYSNEATSTTFFANPAACVAGPNTLCLKDGRFKVEVTWTDFMAQTGPGTDVGLTSTDSGLFYFFSPNNWELLVKVIDGCDSTRHFWVFGAATTDVAYDLVVTDSVSGFSRTYTNELGVASPAIIDTSAFATCFAEVPGAAPVPVEAPEVAAPASAQVETRGGCVASNTRFCFNGGRYAVELEWRNFSGNNGIARIDPLQSEDSGLFYFVDDQNLEVLVKVLDGCADNDRVWVFAAATTNFETTLRVTDTVTDVTREYPNPLGTNAAAITDTFAFDSCPP